MSQLLSNCFIYIVIHYIPCSEFIFTFKSVIQLINQHLIVFLTDMPSGILQAFNTENLIVSTLSVATSFVALFLMILRVPAYAVAFIFNDIVLIVLWSLACMQDIGYLSLAVSFGIFLINDTYTFICWTKRKRRAQENSEQPEPPTKITEI